MLEPKQATEESLISGRLGNQLGRCSAKKSEYRLLNLLFILKYFKFLRLKLQELITDYTPSRLFSG